MPPKKQKRPNEPITADSIPTLLDEFKSYLTFYLHEKDEQLRTEARGGGRGSINLLNPFSIARYLGGVSKNPDHADAYDQRLVFIVYGYYLKQRMESLNKLQEQKKSEQALILIEEIQTIETFLRTKKYKGSFLTLLTQTYIAAKSLPENQTAQQEQKEEPQKKEFRLLWPFYLMTQNPGGLYENADFSAETAYVYAFSNGWLISQDTQPSDEVFAKVFEAMVKQAKTKAPSEKKEEETKTANEEKKVDLPDKKYDDYATENLHGGTRLSSFVRKSDEIMGMSLDPKRFGGDQHIINRIEGNSIFNKAGETLQDGWYQYVIMAEEPYKHDFRYLKCSDKKGSFLQYGKYAAHSEIAGGQAVYSAGAFKVDKGKIIEMDDSSGHYENQKTHVKTNTYALLRLRGLGCPYADQIKQKHFEALKGALWRDKMKRKLSALIYGFVSEPHPDLARLTESRPMPPVSLQGTHLRSFQSEQYRRLFNNMREITARKGPERLSKRELDNMSIAEAAGLLKGNLQLVKYFRDASDVYDAEIKRYFSFIVKKLCEDPDKKNVNILKEKLNKPGNEELKRFLLLRLERFMPKNKKNDIINILLPTQKEQQKHFCQLMRIELIASFNKYHQSIFLFHDPTAKEYVNQLKGKFKELEDNFDSQKYNEVLDLVKDGINQHKGIKQCLTKIRAAMEESVRCEQMGIVDPLQLQHKEYKGGETKRSSF